jgi:hypothetical protein
MPEDPMYCWGITRLCATTNTNRNEEFAFISIYRARWSVIVQGVVRSNDHERQPLAPS